ncbi:MAG TPA: glycosyltransferase [Actinomycetota bacterium]|nr:glycosyltransferase [Actinomycetota bacterium]
MKISLIATVKDDAPFVRAFVDSIHGQTRPPDEVVIVDGGSSDGTLDFLRAADGVRLVEERGANIARGRNVAIRAASNDVIAVSDADCVLAPDWLEQLLPVLEAGADVAAGAYVPLATSFLETCMAAVSVRDPDEIRTGWMPSHRSVAFRRSAFERAGGYPEWLDIGEDMYLNHQLRRSGARIEFAPGAKAYWRPRPTLAATWQQYLRYAEGDAVAGMYPERHLLRFGAYAAAAGILGRTRRPMALTVLAVGALAHSYRPVRRAWDRLPASAAARGAALVTVPALVAIVDAAKMVGYLRGLSARMVSGRAGVPRA